MAHSFQRANQSLRADHGIRSTVVLVTALVLLIAWFTWALRARVPLYQTSLSARSRAASPGPIQIFAEFSPTALGDVRPGQPATFHPVGRASLPYGALPARVSHVAGEIRNGKVAVELSIESPVNHAILIHDGFPGSVEIEVEQVTPAALLMRSAGLVGGH